MVGVGMICCKSRLLLCKMPMAGIRCISVTEHNLNNRPFYKKSERFHHPTASDQEEHKLYFDHEYMGTDGPFPISYNKDYSSSHQHWHQTLNNNGVKTNKSHLSGSNVGVWTNVVSVNPKTCTRSYSAGSYYHDISTTRANLTILPNSLAQQIILEHDNGNWVAKGVRFTHEDQEYTVAARKEVILSAGSVASPQLLELSGIGDPTILQAAGIAVKVANSNVGENLQDHMRKLSMNFSDMFSVFVVR